MAENDKKSGAVYVSWATFKNALEQLSQGVPPNKIDRSVFPGIAWAIQNQLFTGMRFLGLIDQDGKPTVDLEQLATVDENARKKKLLDIFQLRYFDLFALDLRKTTPAELEQRMGDVYGVTGDTRSKAVRFFLSAVEYLGIELSPYFAAKKPNGSPTRRNKPKKTRAGSLPHQAPITQSEQAIAGTAKTVHLGSGGTLTLSATLDLFALNSSDRQFVFGLIDKLDEYEQNSAKTDTPRVGHRA